MEERSILFNYLIADARFDNLRSDSRFPELVRRMGFAAAKVIPSSHGITAKEVRGR